MIKKLVALLLIFNFIILTVNSVSAKPNNTSSPEEFVKEFLCAKMYTLVSKEIDDIDKYYSRRAPNSQKYMMFTKQNLLQDYLIAYASNDYAIEKVSPQVIVISSITKGDTSSVEAVLKTDIYWNACNALGEPINGIKSENHKIVLTKESNSWKIVIDKYMTNRGHSDESIKDDLARLSASVDKLKKDAKESLNKANRSKPSKLTMAFSESDMNISKNKLVANDCEVNQRMSGAITAYNRDSAYNWAHTYWNNYSTAYVNLGAQKWEGGDCTNFVSQCLRAGSSNNDKIGSYIWYYDSKSSYSWTWSTSRGLNYILLGNSKAKEFGPKGSEKVIVGDLNYDETLGQFLTYGDIVQYQWSSSAKLSHSAIIVNMVYNSSKERFEPVIAEHTYDSWYTPWTNNAYKTHFVHITGIN